MVTSRVNPENRERPGAWKRLSRFGGDRGRYAMLARSLLAASAGGLLYWASPPRDLWWLAPVALAVFTLVVRGRRGRAGFGYGFVLGLAYMLPLLGWLLDFLGGQFGPWPWLGVGLVEALFLGLAGAGMARAGRLPLAPVWQSAVFVAAELLRSALPFGGFPWGRLAFTQTGGALLPLASIGGTALVGFGVALTGTALAELVRGLTRLVRAGRNSAGGAERAGPLRGLAVPVAGTLLPVVLGLAVTPTLGTAAESGTARVAVVQGNAPNVGLDLLYRDRQLYANHVRAARELVADVEAGRVARPDFVVLPEQVGSWGAERRDPALRDVVERLGVPVIVGGLATDSAGRLSNRIVRWGPGEGASEEYVKQHLVPFAEKIPLRSVAGAVSPFVRRFDRDMVAGDDPGVLSAGPARLGVGICYDVAYDDVFRGAARSGANLFAVPTNNAWYGRSEMSYQQLAMSRLRAVEHGRSMLVAATSGVSAVVRPDGSVARRTDLFTADTIVDEVPLRSSTTPATSIGEYVTWAVAALGVLAMVLSTLRGRRARRGG
ncbi:apolipoprotein N-acyltransferase [Actinopolyspora biskrensis]|uniref:Apolipoprotein N-acyltransferase n=2 Tax=Actinopolyspora biskrensis TaxID=1470178 RepID=A0A852YU77_9ACTN|nr:apolipoprotein N-acyltransferase [Actinopolyspora biskrensis]NYH77119.1 apolipoprotein N-acyltransferase [Actinopolyspora biskrensis]